MRRLVAIAVILVIIVVIIVTVKIEISNNENCTVLNVEFIDPQPYQYPFDNVSTCCTSFTFSHTVSSYASSVTITENLGNIVTTNGTSTITFSGYPGVEWTETVCTYTG